MSEKWVDNVYVERSNFCNRFIICGKIEISNTELHECDYTMMVNMEWDEICKYLNENFNCYIQWAMPIFYTKEDAQNAINWLESVMMMEVLMDEQD